MFIKHSIACYRSGTGDCSFYIGHVLDCMPHWNRLISRYKPSGCVGRRMGDYCYRTMRKESQIPHAFFSSARFVITNVNEVWVILSKIDLIPCTLTSISNLVRVLSTVFPTTFESSLSALDNFP